ncbi:MAG: hypothetical protein NZO16_07915, partial [Deltaproteobacteria bacterium]|nr:hypothetical protein [Deltaproteobacteria bacterium]
PLLIRDLANIGFKVLILGKIRHENLDFSSNANVVNLTGKTSVKDCLYLVSRSAVVLSNDSFGAHLAMGYGKPLILFLCSTGDQHGFFQSELVVKFHPVQLTCWPCSIGGRALCPVSRCECIDYEYDLTKIVEFIKHFANKR